MKLKYLYIWLIGLLAIGCFDDDTTVDGSDIRSGH